MAKRIAEREGEERGRKQTVDTRGKEVDYWALWSCSLRLADEMERPQEKWRDWRRLLWQDSNPAT